MTMISVIMSVYNSEAYLEKAIESVLSQTYKNFEFIIINDGSQDSSLEIIKSYAANDDRIICLSRGNKGLAYSLNEGISIARGDYIARMDADDICLPERFERQLEWISFTGADVCGGGYQIIDAFDKPLIGRQVVFPSSSVDVKIAMAYQCPIAHPTVLMRACIGKRFLYDIKYECAQDFELWTRVALSGHEFTNVPEVVLLYRVHGSQITKAKNDRQKNASKNIIFNYLTNCEIFGFSLKPLLPVLNRNQNLAFSDILGAMRCLNLLSKKAISQGVKDALTNIRLLLAFRATVFGVNKSLWLSKRQNFTFFKSFQLACLALLRADKIFRTILQIDSVRHFLLKFV